jgi:ABC-type Zn uptake system ZnuABC Zn-binding protein ZnuA
VGVPRLLPLLACLPLLLGACGGTAGRGDDGRVQVVTSTLHLADLARQAGGDRVAVRSLLQPNSDPHDYEPRPADVQAIAQADVVLVSGLGLDDWAREAAAVAGNEDAVLAVGERVPVRRQVDGGPDPHWWQDPRNLAASAGVIGRAIVGADPALEATVRARTARFDRAVARLDRRVAACVARVAPAQRKLVTDHDAFGLLAARYGLRVVGTVLPSRSAEAQASAGDVAALVATIRRERVRAVFPEQQLEPRLARAVAQRAGVASDFSLLTDTLGAPGTPEATVLGALAHNARELVRGMSGGTVACDARA